MTSGAMANEVYVWQRAWTPPVKEAIDRVAPKMRGLNVLGAEITFRGDRPAAIRASVDWRGLAAVGRPVGVSLRVGPCRGRLYEDGAAVDFLADAAAKLLAEARSGGLEPAELQIDFDCAESDLDGYACWVRAVRMRTAPTPLAITALPCWLKHRAFARLAAEAGGYVLQVHSLERPRGPEDRTELCDVASARRAVERAGRIGVPFRVALPTYGYLMAFDGRDRFLGLSAEGPMPAWGPDVRLRELRADPAAMAELVRGWTGARPACMGGVIWYRLPVDTDALNWSWATLAAVMDGRVPTPFLRTEIRRPEAGLAEVVLGNSGEADGPAGASVRVSWSGSRLLAADAIGGFGLAGRGAGEATFVGRSEGPDARLTPGRSRTIGWLRFSEDPEVTADVVR